MKNNRLFGTSRRKRMFHFRIRKPSTDIICIRSELKSIETLLYFLIPTSSKVSTGSSEEPNNQRVQVANSLHTLIKPVVRKAYHDFRSLYSIGTTLLLCNGQKKGFFRRCIDGYIHENPCHIC